MFRFMIRDVLWLTVVAALALGWWLDRDQIRRETQALRKERLELQALPLTRAEKALAVIEAELASLVEIEQRSPGAVSEREIRLVELRRDVARLDVEKARAKEMATLSRQ